MTELKDTGRTSSGRFAKGVSGNPNGRARMPAALREILAAKAHEAVEAIARNISDPDPRIALKAAELLLDRAYGKPPPASEGIALADTGDTTTPDGLLKLHAAMLQAVANGNIALAEARDFSGLLETHRRLMETVDLEARLSRLEKDKGQ